MRDNKALIARLLNESGVATGGINARVALMDKAADALEKADRIERADSKVIDILQAHIIDLEQKLTEQAATIEAALKITDDMRSDGWPSGNTVPGLGDKLYHILSGTEGTR